MDFKNYEFPLTLDFPATVFNIFLSTEEPRLIHSCHQHNTLHLEGLFFHHFPFSISNFDIEASVQVLGHCHRRGSLKKTLRWFLRCEIGFKGPRSITGRQKHSPGQREKQPAVLGREMEAQAKL